MLQKLNNRTPCQTWQEKFRKLVAVWSQLTYYFRDFHHFLPVCTGAWAWTYLGPGYGVHIPGAVHQDSQEEEKGLWRGRARFILVVAPFWEGSWGLAGWTDWAFNILWLRWDQRMRKGGSEAGRSWFSPLYCEISSNHAFYCLQGPSLRTVVTQETVICGSKVGRLIRQMSLSNMDFPREHLST